jgi:ERCC4-type nuclease
VDTREPPQFFEVLSEYCSVPIEVRMLQCGDFIFEDVVFERKEIHDFVGSIIPKEGKDKGRIFAQEERMLGSFPHRYIFVHQSLEEYSGNVHPHAILGALARLLVDDVKVCFGISNEEEFCYLLLKVLEKLGKLKVIPPKKKRSEKI